MSTDRAARALCLGLCMVWAAPLQAEAPLSAIDWLSQSLMAPPQGVVVTPGSPQAAGLPDDVTTSVLGQVSLNSVGILPPQITGLPRNLWGMGRAAEIEQLLAAGAPQHLPALQGLMMTLLLAEAEPPADAAKGEDLLLVRIDKLLSIGALDQARALLDAAGPTASPALFRRYFDVSLLIGDEDRACRLLRDAPGLAPALPTRIFCLARQGDYDAAWLTLDTARSLGTVSTQDVALLERFMDPELDDSGQPLALPNPVTPLALRIFEAVGEPLSVSTLPLAFAYADLSETAGWKAQVEAAERLSRAGVIAPNMLLGLYTNQKPAASGGVWDRVAAFQKLDDAVSSADLRGVDQALPAAWAEMRGAELEVPFATIFAERLSRLSLGETASEIVFHISLLSSDYESLAAARAATSARDQFLAALAQGDLTGSTTSDAMAAAITQAFTAPEMGSEFRLMLEQKRVGEVILLAMSRIEHGTTGDLRGVTEGLSVLRHIGLEDVARRAALELVLLERRG